MTEDFSPSAYRALLERLVALGYTARSYEDAEPARADLIVRHDIDMSLQVAAETALIEQALGVRAVYFVLLQTEMYNALSRMGREAIHRILSLGHEVGLHFDASDQTDVGMMDRAAQSECRILEEVTERPIRVISFHRPAPHLLGLEAPVAGRIHTYMPRFFTEMGYCSDSQGRWRFGHPLGHPAVAERRALQLLTHPIWWQVPAALDPVARLERFSAVRRALLEKELAANCLPFRDHHEATRQREQT